MRLYCQRAPCMRLVVLRSAWGLKSLRSDPARAIAAARRAGFEGIEASLNDIGSTSSERRALCAVLRSQGMGLVISAYSSWDSYVGPFDGKSSVSDHVHQMKRELDDISEVIVDGPAVYGVNCHSGSDAWSEAEAADFFEATAEVVAYLGGALPPTSHETHRGRYLCCPFATSRMLQHVPTLRLTSDLSHWVVKCERLLDSAEELQLLHSTIAPRVDHIHARIGTPQGAQVADVRSPLTQAAAERFYTFWEAVWSAHDAKSTASHGSIMTATMEYGPAEFDGDYAGYTPVDLGGKPLSPNSLDETVCIAADDLRSRFERWGRGVVFDERKLIA